MNELINQKYTELQNITQKFLQGSFDYPSAKKNFKDEQEFQVALLQNIESLKKVIMDFYTYCCKEKLFDDFVVLFASYCNFSIIYGLSCFVNDTEETMFGLEKSKFNDCEEHTLLPYLEQVYLGIKNKDDNYFKKAEKINNTFTVAHLYLFAKATNLYFWFLECVDDSVCESLTKSMLSSSHSESVQKVIKKIQLWIEDIPVEPSESKKIQLSKEIYQIIADFFIDCLKKENVDDFISYLLKIKQSKYSSVFVIIENCIINSIKNTEWEEKSLNLSLMINKLEIIQYCVFYCLEEIPKESFEDVSQFQSCKDFFITKYNDTMLNQYRLLSANYRRIVLENPPMAWLPSVTFVSGEEMAYRLLQSKRSEFLNKLTPMIENNIEQFELIDELSYPSKIEHFLKVLQDGGNVEEYFKVWEDYMQFTENILFPATIDFSSQPIAELVKSEDVQKRMSVLNLRRFVRFGDSQHLLQFFFQMDEMLDKKNKELEQEQKRRENLITSFTHDQKHCIYPKIIQKVSDILLKKGDEENSFKLYHAYNEAQYQNHSFDKLYLQYRQNSEKMLEDFHSSLSIKRGVVLEQLLEDSLNLVLFRFLMNDVDTEHSTVQVRKKLEQWLCISDLREEYTNLFLIQKDEGSNIRTWFSKHFYPLTIEIEKSSKWNFVRFKKNDTAYFTFFNIFINLFHNALNYGRKSLVDGWMKIHFDSIVEKENKFLTIEFSNPIETETAYEEGYGQGITNIYETIFNLNCCIYPDMNKKHVLITKKENNIFSVKLYFAEALLIKKV